jgi:hypothetical protein
MDIMDKSTIVATDTNIQIPNYVSGTRGDDITFGGNINVEKNDYLELGKGLPKGDNAGKIRYQGENLEIFGAGKNGDPYKVKLWDDVEVGGLLQANSALQFGKDQGKIHYDTNAKNLNIMGPGTDGQRKVKIWDDVEVGKLLSTNGIEVRGPFRAYNDMNISGALNAGNIQSARISVGDLDISGNINNTGLNTRLSQLDQRIQEHRESIANNPGLIALETRVSSLTDKINGAPVPVDASLFNQLQSQVAQLRTDATNTSALERANADLKTDILRTVSASLDAARSNTEAQLSNMLNTLSTTIDTDKSTKTMSDASLNMMFAKYDLSLQNISSQVNLAMAKAVENAPDQDWIKNKSKLLKWADLEPAKLNAFANANLNISKLNALTNASLDVSKLNALTNTSVDLGPNGKLAKLANSNLNVSMLSSWSNASKTYNELQDTLATLSGRMNGHDESRNSMNATLLGLPNTYVTSTWANNNLAKKTDLTTAITGINASYIPKTDANNYVTSTWANNNLAKKTDLNAAITGLNATYIPKTEANSYARFDSNNNLPVPGNLLVGNENKWKLDPLPDSLRVTKQ